MQEQVQEKTSTFDQADIDKNKTMAGLAYLIFFLPLLACPESKYAKFHANQALLLFIVAVGGNIVLSIIPFIGWVLLPIFAVVIFIFAIIGMINGFTGKAKRLPIFGKFNILK
ncbi:MAG: hypothetical protein GX094_04500 [Clostridiales bacterium]|jgi:uncharacterized membrane protein|nr:hypothetical protein [Clostridiales bacterium]